MSDGVQDYECIVDPLNCTVPFEYIDGILLDQFIASSNNILATTRTLWSVLKNHHRSWAMLQLDVWWHWLMVSNVCKKTSTIQSLFCSTTKVQWLTINDWIKEKIPMNYNHFLYSLNNPVAERSLGFDDKREPLMDITRKLVLWGLWRGGNATRNDNN